MRKYEIIRLIDGQKILNEPIKPIAPEHEKALEVLSVIVEIEKSRLVRYNGSLHGRQVDDEIIFIHTGKNLIGTAMVQSETTLTADATDAEIDAALRKYAAARFKLHSMVMYPLLPKLRMHNDELVTLMPPV